MAGAFIEIRTEDSGIRDVLERLQAKLSDLTPVFRDIGEALLISHRERFDRGEAPDGTPWPELSPRYLRRKPKNRDKKLVLDGWLRQLHYQADPHSLRLGTDRIYGATHQFGRPEENIPARPFLGLDAEERQTVVDILSEWLADA